MFNVQRSCINVLLTKQVHDDLHHMICHFKMINMYEYVMIKKHFLSRFSFMGFVLESGPWCITGIRGFLARTPQPRLNAKVKALESGVYNVPQRT